MTELLWLTVLGPLGAALASWSRPSRASTMLGLTVATAGILAGLLAPGPLEPIRWLPRNGITLVAVGLRPWPPALLALLALLAHAGIRARGEIRAVQWCALTAASISLLALESLQALAGLSVAAALTACDPRQQWAGRGADLLSLAGVGALYHYTASTDWSAPLLAGSPQAHLIAGLFLAGIAGHLCLQPGPMTRAPVVTWTLAGAVLVPLSAQAEATSGTMLVGAAVSVLCLLWPSEPQHGTQRAWGPMLVLLFFSGAIDVLWVAVLAYPILMLLPRGTHTPWVALLCGFPLSVLYGDGHVLLASGLGLGLLWLGRQQPHTVHWTLLASGVSGVAVLLLVSSGVLGGSVVLAWSGMAASVLLWGAGVLSVRIWAPPDRSRPGLWDGGWRHVVRPLASLTARVPLPALPDAAPQAGRLVQRIHLESPRHQGYAFAVLLLVVILYGLGVSR